MKVILKVKTRKGRKPVRASRIACRKGGIWTEYIPQEPEKINLCFDIFFEYLTLDFSHTETRSLPRDYYITTS